MRVSTCHCAVGAVVCECLRATVPWVPSCASVCVPLCRCARVSACHCRFGCLNSLVLFGATRVYPAAFRGADLLARPLARTSTWMFPLRFAINNFAPHQTSAVPWPEKFWKLATSPTGDYIGAWVPHPGVAGKQNLPGVTEPGCVLLYFDQMIRNLHTE